MTEDDIYLFREGTHADLHKRLGAHLVTEDGEDGTLFAVWAPNAESVSVIGDFNGWDPVRHPLTARGEAGVWEGFIAGVGHGAVYKYHIVSRYKGYRVDKADPFGFRHEVAPQTGSIVWNLDYAWGDDAWMKARGAAQRLDRPISIYEVHLGSWRRSPGADGPMLGYREIAPLLADHVASMGFTHVELMPVMEHPFYGSWGYQGTGYFAASSRYGTPQDLMFLIDTLHRRGIGVLLDWVPSHFPGDEHGLIYFDGTHLFEHAHPSRGFQPDWNSYIFNCGRNEVGAFLISSALFWLGIYHADGLRVDAVASMLYLDYSRKEGEWMPNRFGGRENLEAIAFLRRLNEVVYGRHPDVLMIAEESTAWPMVSRPVYLGGLGFGLKWDMGWMHDTLEYMGMDPVHRKFHHTKVTFRMLYAFSENFLLPLSHDEVVHGKRSLLAKMPGDEWRRFANLRLLLGSMFAQPAKKLLFMGAEFGQIREWNHDRGLDWDLLEKPRHAQLSRWMADLNRLYAEEPALHETDCDPSGFEWIDPNDADQSVASFVRRSKDGKRIVLVLENFTPVPRGTYRIGVPEEGSWQEILNSDALEYGGSGVGNFGARLETEAVESHRKERSIVLTIAPLAVLFLRWQPAE